MTEPLLRARLLIEQRRWELAERELRRTLAETSDDSEAHRLLAICLAEREQFDDAEEEARLAITLAPDQAATHLALASVLHDRHRYPEAAVATAETLRLDPYNVTAFGLQADLALIAKNWQQALDSAMQGLVIDPDDITCNNMRAIALVKLGRRSEAGRTIDAALARNPDDAVTHANQGWTLLQAGDSRKALEHFRESLRLDPGLEWAQSGIVEALKARNIVYRMLLGYMFYVSRLSNRTQWMLMIGLYVLAQIIGSVGNQNPKLAVILLPVLIVYIVFAVITWIGYPLFNLLLFLDKFGRLALSDDQRKGAMTLGGVLLSALLLCGASFVLPGEAWLLGEAALKVALLALPTSAIFNCAAGTPRRAMLGISAAVALLAVAPLLIYILDMAALLDNAGVGRLASKLMEYSRSFFVIGIIGSQFAATSLSRMIPTR